MLACFAMQLLKLLQQDEGEGPAGDIDTCSPRAAEPLRDGSTEPHLAAQSSENEGTDEKGGAAPGVDSGGQIQASSFAVPVSSTTCYPLANMLSLLLYPKQPSPAILFSLASNQMKHMEK